MRIKPFILLVLALGAGSVRSAPGPTLANPTIEQLMQAMRSQPGVDINAPVTAAASFDPPQIRPEEKAVYRVVLNAAAVSVEWPETLPLPPGLSVRLSCSGQIVQGVGGAFQNFASFNYDVRADAPGQFTIPAFTVNVYGKPVVIPATQLEVKAVLPETHEPVRQLFIQPSSTNVFVGEPLDISVLLPASSSGSLEAVSDVQLNGGGFLVDKDNVRQSIRPMEVNGRIGQAFVYETGITPMAAGTLRLSAQGFTSGMRFGGPVVINGRMTIPGGPPNYLLLDSEPVAINVRPLPAGSELPGFLGAVGDYACDPPELATNILKVGEPVQLRVVIRGPKNLSRINPPLPLPTEGWQIFPAKSGGIIPGTPKMNPGAVFDYTLIPLTEAVQGTPMIPFSCFDPERGKCVDLSIPSLPVTVQAGDPQTVAAAALMLSEKIPQAEQKSGLSGLAASPGWTFGGLVPLQLRGWFPVVQIFPALVLCGLWGWDRRRRYLEQHPEVVRRRLARRALRRERRRLDQAAASGNPNQFVRCAINALQIASAPHYPAAPRALVCGDVLQILPAREREGKAGDTIRRFFAAADAVTFANSGERGSELFAEKTTLKETLSQMEARL